jgi:hypothetical protein
VKAEAEIGVMQPQAKGCLESTKARMARSKSFLKVFGGNTALLHSLFFLFLFLPTSSFQTLGLQNHELKRNFSIVSACGDLLQQLEGINKVPTRYYRHM